MAKGRMQERGTWGASKNFGLLDGLMLCVAHSENHCCVHQDFSKDWYSRKMLHASPVASRHLFLHRTLQGLHTGPVWETHEFRGPEQPLEGQVADAFLYPQGFAGRGGEMSRSGL